MLGGLEILSGTIIAFAAMDVLNAGRTYRFQMPHSPRCATQPVAPRGGPTLTQSTNPFTRVSTGVESSPVQNQTMGRLTLASPTTPAS
jgi:hypothetical protein